MKQAIRSMTFAGRHRYLLASLLACSVAVTAASASDTRAGRPVPVAANHVTIDDAFWSPKMKTWRTVTIKDCLDKFERDGAFRNFDHVARNELHAPHGGPPWYDGLVYEVIRGAADLLAREPDPALLGRIDGFIGRISAAAARDPNGYINTYTQMREPGHRWGQNGGNDREQHDLYNIGCLVEAGIHYYRATGKTKLLATAVRAANGMAAVMGPPPRKNIIPGHALSEESFVRLYELFRQHPQLKQDLAVPVDEKSYLDLARFWIDARGHHEGRQSFGEYGQDHMPVLEQATIEGHAVRATLLAAGVAAFGAAGEQPQYVEAAERLWRNMVTGRLYITGGVGSIAADEKFGGDFFLPNDGYLETCAAVACGFLDFNLFLATADAAKIDELERSLYNGALAGVSLQGNTYFYENPLEAGRKRARWSWHACPCCPPMFLKLMGALPGYIYASDAEGLYVNLFIGSRAKIDLEGENGKRISVTQTTNYPWDGDVQLAVDSERPATFDVRIRVPAWCQGGAISGGLYTLPKAAHDAFSISINGQPISSPTIVRGYAALRKEWRAGDKIHIRMAMPAQRVRANDRVESDRGRAALIRGPIVYCLESHDNQGRLRDMWLPDTAPITADWRPELLGGVTTLRAKAKRLPLGDDKPVDTEVVAIPYYANANRGPAEMIVWVPTTSSGATRPTIASLSTPTASHCFASDTVDAMNDGAAPRNSSDETRKRFTWWDHRGTNEWAQYDFDQPRRVSATSVYWWDDSRLGRHCAPPVSWRLLFRKPNGTWAPVQARGEFGTKLDIANTVEFDPIETTALRIEAILRPNLSAGILEWQVAPAATAEKPAKLSSRPWRVFGRVTDEQGRPLARVVVRAFCGMGTLRLTGSKTSDNEGRYTLDFGPGVLTASRKGVADSLQVATISAAMPGYFEENLNRQGGCHAATATPDEAQLKRWGGTRERLFLPAHPLEIDFKMRPAGRVSGKLIDEQWKPLAGYSIGLAGVENPPSMGAVRPCEADAAGRFVLEDIPTTFRYQFAVRKSDPKPPWEDSWASAALRFERPSKGDMRAWFGEREIRVQDLVIRVIGPGVHSRTATPAAGNAGLLHLTAAGPGDVLEQTKTLVAANAAVLTVSNSPQSIKRPSLITESIPAAPEATPTRLARTRPSPSGEFTISFENPSGVDLKPGVHQVVFQLFVGVSHQPIRKRITRQLDVRNGRYVVPVKIPPRSIDDSRVSITFLTIQPNHDAWVKSFFEHGSATSYKGIWTGDSATLPAIPFSLPDRN